MSAAFADSLQPGSITRLFLTWMKLLELESKNRSSEGIFRGMSSYLQPCGPPTAADKESLKGGTVWQLAPPTGNLASVQFIPPRPVLSTYRMVPLNRMGSCRMMDSRERSVCSGSLAMSISSMTILPWREAVKVR